MESIICNVKDINAADRLALEHVIGQRLAEDQQLVIRVVNAGVRTDPPSMIAAPELPAWCNVYEGLSDEELSAIEQVAVTRADLSRE